MMKYVMANIKIPIEITKTGEQISHTDRTIVEFTPCNELPPQQNMDDIDFTALLQNLLNDKNKNTDIINKWNETTISRDNIKKKVKPKNMSFRKKIGTHHNFTVKNF
jgi:hypothetical protein